MIELRTPTEIEQMRPAGRFVAEVLAATAGAAKVGVTPDAAPAPADEAALGAQLLSIVAGSREAGLDAERALRAALRTLARDVESAEGAG